MNFYMPYNEFIVFTKEKDNLLKFMDEYSHLIDGYGIFNDEENIFIIVCGFYLDEMEEGLGMFLNKFNVFATVTPTTDEILEKVSNGEELTMRDKWLLHEFSQREFLLFKE